MPPKLPPSPPELVERFHQVAAAAAPDAHARPMFGYPSLTLNGHMFFSLFGDHMVLRLGDDDRRELAEQGGTVFEPMPGRPMTGYLAVPPALAGSAAIEAWVKRARDHAATLPPKKPKTKPTPKPRA